MTTETSVGSPGAETTVTAVGATVGAADTAKAPVGAPETQGKAPGDPPDFKVIDAKDKADAAAGAKALTQAWGAEAKVNFASLADGLQSLSREDREELEFAELPDGRLLLNSPEHVQEILKVARTAPPVLVAAAKKYDGNELAALKEMMANRASPYWKGKDAPHLQWLYRDHLRRGSK